MTREEYELVYSAFKSYRVYMTDAEEVLSEKILDDLFYPQFDKLASENDVFDDIVKDAEEALANESALHDIHTEKDLSEDNEIKSLNVR